MGLTVGLGLRRNSRVRLVDAAQRGFLAGMVVAAIVYGCVTDWRDWSFENGLGFRVWFPVFGAVLGTAIGLAGRLLYCGVDEAPKVEGGSR